VDTPPFVVPPFGRGARRPLARRVGIDEHIDETSRRRQPQFRQAVTAAMPGRPVRLTAEATVSMPSPVNTACRRETFPNSTPLPSISPSAFFAFSSSPPGPYSVSFPTGLGSIVGDSQVRCTPVSLPVIR
jgi:hypothetical protein